VHPIKPPEEEDEEPETDAHPHNGGADALDAEDVAVREREGNGIPLQADISTLLRHMKQLSL